MGAAIMHTKDADCTIGADGCCIGCGVLHWEPCGACGGKGFHANDCALMLAEAFNPDLLPRTFNPDAAAEAFYLHLEDCDTCQPPSFCAEGAELLMETEGR